VWSDNEQLKYNSDHVTFIYKECLGFPSDSLFRFDTFLTVENFLLDYDYVYFINSNAVITDYVGEEVIPDDTGLVVAEWPIKHKWLSSPCFYNYERNKSSLAYIPPFASPYKYFMGGFNGGKAVDYLKLIHILSKNIHIDYDNGILACSYDESHLNKYCHDNVCKVLPYGFASPEEWGRNHDTRIVFRHKGILDSNKNRAQGLKGRIIRTLYLIKKAISWYF